MTPQAQALVNKEYNRWLDAFWERSATLAQIVTEDFPPEGGPATRYHVDAMRDIAARIGALLEGYERPAG